MKVGIVMGSASDREVMTLAKEELEKFSVEVDMKVYSAHRTPRQAVQWVADCEKNGVQVIIAAAGLAAHLAGVVAAHTRMPVLGVPMPGGVMGGLDALLSTVQMPKGTPVATFAVGKAGAINAALFAVRILSVGNPQLREKLEQYQLDMEAEIVAANN